MTADDLAVLVERIEQEEEQKEKVDTRVVEGQPRRIEPAGSTATGNEVPVSDSHERT